jgi:hypothetical protein
MGLGIFGNRRLPPSSRLHESGMWQSLYRLEIEMVRVLRSQTGRLGGATERLGRATGRLGSAMGRNLGAVKGLQWCVSSIGSPSVIWKITRECVNCDNRSCVLGVLSDALRSKITKNYDRKMPNRAVSDAKLAFPDCQNLAF